MAHCLKKVKDCKVEGNGGCDSSGDVFCGFWRGSKKLHSALAFTFVPANELVLQTYEIIF